MGRNGRAKKRKRGNDSKAVDVVAKALRKNKKRKSRRKRKSKFQKRTGAPQYNMSRAALRKELGRFCPPQLNFPITSHSGLPPIHRCRQMASVTTYLSGTGVSVPSYHLHVNSIFNAFNLSSGFRVQPPGYDILATAYDRYVVLSASVLVVPMQSVSNDCLIDMNYWLDNTQLTADRADTWEKAKDRGMKMGFVDHDWAAEATSSTGTRTTLKKSHKIYKNLVNSGGGALFGEESSAVVGSDPSSLSTMSLYLTNTEGGWIGLNQTQYFRIYISFDVVYYSPSTSIAD